MRDSSTTLATSRDTCKICATCYNPKLRPTYWLERMSPADTVRAAGTPYRTTSFGEQTAIKTGKGGLKGITLSPELVTERIDSFPISVYLSDAMGHMYSRLINYPTLRHRPNTKRKVINDGSLNLTTGRHFRQNLQNIPTHGQSKAKSSTKLSMVRSFLRMSICG